MRLLITGASGKLGGYLVEEAVARGHDVVAWVGGGGLHRPGIQARSVDLFHADRIALCCDQDRPGAVIHAAAISATQAVREDPSKASRINVAAGACLKEWCDRSNVPLVFTSTDMVFDGASGGYSEQDSPRPIMKYGETKEHAERILLRDPASCVVRLSLLYGPALGAKKGFYDQAMADLRSGKPRAFFMDEYRTPLDYATAARVLIRMAEEPVPGVWHLGGCERVSRYELMRRVAIAQGIHPGLVRPESLKALDAEQDSEPRPQDLSLDCAKLEARYPGLRPATIEDAVAGWATMKHA